jgi:hypothetical protein
MKAFLFAALLALTAAPVAAQALVGPAQYPQVDFGRLTPGDPVPGEPGKVFQHTGQGWIVADAPVPDTLVCDPLPNPYTEPEKVLACNARTHQPLPPDAVPTFLIGHVYAFAYSTAQARVISIGTDEDGVQVVTVRWLTTGGRRLEAIRTPPTAGGSSVWWLVR